MEINKNNIPVFELLIDENDNQTGTMAIALVKSPAVDKSFLKFSEEIKKEQFKVTNTQEQILTGVVAIPDMLISRGDHFVYFSEKTIKKMVMKFAKNMKFDQVNLEHDLNQFTDKCYVFESWIAGKQDKANELGFNVPEKTWMISMKVNDDKLWQQAMNGDFTGFSLEGMFAHVESSLINNDEQIINQILDILKKIM